MSSTKDKNKILKAIKTSLKIGIPVAVLCTGLHACMQGKEITIDDFYVKNPYVLTGIAIQNYPDTIKIRSKKHKVLLGETWQSIADGLSINSDRYDTLRLLLIANGISPQDLFGVENTSQWVENNPLVDGQKIWVPISVISVPRD